MTFWLSHSRAGACQAATCRYAPCFQARLEAAGHCHESRLSKEAGACAGHLGEMVQALTAWAHSQGLTGAELTVLAVDPPPLGIPPAFRGAQDGLEGHALAFSTLRL